MDIHIKGNKDIPFCLEKRPENCTIIIFGASGDLTSRKIMPALWNLYRRNLVPDKLRIIGCARTSMTDDGFRRKTAEVLGIPDDSSEKKKKEEFLRILSYQSGDYSSRELYAGIQNRIHEAAEQVSSGNILFYLAVPPVLFGTVTRNLNEQGLIGKYGNGVYTRFVFEKPFGNGIETARSLNGEIHRFLSEPQIYRIDHYLGKETVQNILMLRFANTVFEPVWNRQYIDNIQITVAESVGVEHRAGYYESAGCLRDMFQNHMMQMLALIAEEPASSFQADRLRDERVKLLRSIRPFPPGSINEFAVRGQYSAGEIEGKKYIGYRDEEGVHTESQTETYAALKILIDNWRWEGVPFYLRSGKRLPAKLTEIRVIFKHVPHSMFALFSEESLSQNVLVLNVQPEEGFSLTIQAKQPGPKLCMNPLSMDFRYSQHYGFELPEAYERLILDIMQGDQTLFVRNDTLDQAWLLLQPLLEAWEKNPGGPAEYSAGTWGPEEADRLLEKDGRAWGI